MRLLLLLFQFAMAAAEVTDPLAQISQYLGLSTEQRTAVTRNFNESGAVAAKLYYRIAILREEISKEIVRANPSPMEIGTRRVEIETSCRTIVSAQDAVYEKNLALLTQAQKGKLKALEEVRSGAQLVVSAQAGRFLKPPPYLQLLDEEPGGIVFVSLEEDAPPAGGIRGISAYVIPACGNKGGTVLLSVARPVIP